ncbi:MAG: alkaline shock response membrane anchor protein AmaP [Candidatus Omnitrophota bacterium]
MRFFTALGIFFYTAISFIVGGFLIAFALDWLKLQDIYTVLGYTQVNLNSKIITGLAGFLLVVISISFAQIILGKMEKEKTIAFNTPTGQVTIALAAVEDLIKRLTQNFSEIKELRPNVIAGKKGVEVDLRIVLYSEVNIPELTTHLQDIIKTKIQEMLGIEEQVTVKVHIAKIITYGEKKRAPAAPASEETLPPYSGYRRT